MEKILGYTALGAGDGMLPMMGQGGAAMQEQLRQLGEQTVNVHGVVRLILDSGS